MTSLLKGVNFPLREVMTDAWPRERPTLPLGWVLEGCGWRGEDGGKGDVLRGNDFEKNGEDGEILDEHISSCTRTFSLPLQRNNTAKGEGGKHTGSALSIILSDSATQMQKIPKNIYHRSNVS